MLIHGCTVLKLEFRCRAFQTEKKKKLIGEQLPFMLSKLEQMMNSHGHFINDKVRSLVFSVSFAILFHYRSSLSRIRLYSFKDLPHVYHILVK